MSSGIEGLKAAGTLTGQLITVSAGLLTFTVTFVEKFTPAGQRIEVPLSLKLSWICFVASIVFGFLTLMGVTGTLNELDRGIPESNPERWNIRVWAIGMFVVFFLGIVFLAATGWTIAGR